MTVGLDLIDFSLKLKIFGRRWSPRVLIIISLYVGASRVCMCVLGYNMVFFWGRGIWQVCCAKNNLVTYFRYTSLGVNQTVKLKSIYESLCNISNYVVKCFWKKRCKRNVIKILTMTFDIIRPITSQTGYCRGAKINSVCEYVYSYWDKIRLSSGVVYALRQIHHKHSTGKNRCFA